MRIGTAMLAALAGAAALSLSACSPKVDQTAEPASGEALVEYSDDANGKVELGRDSALVQRLCMNGMGTRCPEGFEAKLHEYGFDGSGTALDLANTVVKIVADAKDGTPDQYSSDEDFYAAAYKTVLNRAPDEGGASANLELIRASAENRRPVVKSLLESQEFKDLH